MTGDMFLDILLFLFVMSATLTIAGRWSYSKAPSYDKTEDCQWCNQPLTDNKCNACCGPQKKAK